MINLKTSTFQQVEIILKKKLISKIIKLYIKKTFKNDKTHYNITKTLK